MNKTYSIASILTGYLCLIIITIYPIKSQACITLMNIPLPLSHPPSDTLRLNNGNKWKVDENMMNRIRSIEQEIIKFEKSLDKNYKGLANRLQSHLNLLISNCTMKGKAHDELHKWLLPFMDNVKELRSPGKEEMGENKFRIIQKSMREFNQYFE